MSNLNTPRRTDLPIPRRDILSALSGDDDVRKRIPTIAEQKIEQEKKVQRRMAEKKIEVLSDRRVVLIDKLLRISDAVKSEGVSVHLLRLHLDTLRRCSDEIEKIHSEIIAIVPRHERDDHETEYVNFEELHNQLYVVLQTAIRMAEDAEIKPQNMVVPAVPQPVYVQAPAPQLHAPFPTFNGSPENWYSFKSLFQNIMSKYPNETNAMKILHLRNALVGDAKNKIDQEVINNNDYNQAWKILENAYEDKRLIMDTHIDAILDIPKVTKENRGKSIAKLVDICSKHTEALSGHGYKVVGLAELILVNVLYKKLDKETQEQWELELGSGDLPVFKDFVDFLRERGRVLSRINRVQQPMSQQSTVQPKSRQVSSQKLPVLSAAKSFVQTVKESCPCCKGEHSIYRCPKFQGQDVSERKAVVFKSNLCFNCLKANHRVSECPSDQGCKVQGCNRKHHSLLHPTNAVNPPSSSTKVPEPKPSQSTPSEESSAPEQPNATTLCAQASVIKRNVLLSTAEVLVAGKGGSTIKSRALLDSGSDSHIITERLASQLRLNLERIDLPINGLNDIQTKVKYSLSTKVHSRVGTFATSALDFLVVPKVTSTLPVVEIDVRSLSLPDNLPLADPSFHTPGEVDMILGNEIFFDLIKPGRMKLGNNTAVLAETELGWVVGGSIHPRSSKQLPRICQLNRFEAELNRTMVKFWEVESVPTRNLLTETEAAVEAHFKDTFFRDEQGRYHVRLPFNELKDQLGDSYYSAKKQFERLKVALDRNPEKRAQYAAFMDEYEALGHMKKVNHVDERGYFIPHHAVYKPTSSTSQIRVVYNGSAKTSTGVSLNDILLVGPTVQSDLFSIVLRFSTHTVVLSVDVPKMYRQVGMHPDDCRYLRILWLNEKGEEQVFELQTVTYGVSSSPYHATRALMQLAKDEGQDFPLAVEVVVKDSYIDDFLTGGESVEAVIAIYEQLSALLAKGGFGVHKISSNSREVLDAIPEHLHEKQVCFEDSGVNNTIKTLGLLWNPLEDYYSFQVQQLDDGSKVSTTKRTVLSDIGRLFDPLGFLGPIVTSAKLVMQEVWRLGLEWDEVLPDDLLQNWRNLREQLSIVNQMRKQRLVIPKGAVRVELHGFSDASQRAYGAVLYTRSIMKDGAVMVHLVASKSRVAPLKPMTIPRLELCGAKLLAELTDKVITAMRVKFDEVKLWCDSQIVLCWLKKPPATLNLFVANRVATVLESTKVNQWNYVRSESNPADVISRGEYPEDLLRNELWWKGSPWLWQSEMEVEVPDSLDETVLPEMKPVKVLAVISSSPAVQFNRMSHFRKLLRAWVYVRRFITPNRQQPLSSLITADEMAQAEKSILLMVQKEAFGDLFKRLRSNKRHNIGNLTPFIGEDGLIRVGGRLKYSAIPYEGRHQVLLPEKHHVTIILIRRLHEDNFHVGPSGLLAIVRERYWPIRATSTIKQITSACQTCAKCSPVLGKQLMGNLPWFRVNPAPVFSKVGVDYAGPFMLRLSPKSPKTYKAYVLVFVCMAVKAIHFELVSNLTTQNFIAALHRFASCRGFPSDIYSDNGTSFVGANHELAALRELFEEQQHQLKLAEFCSAERVRWHFIPPRSPHFGGVWEAGVKSMKYHLKRVVGETRLTYEEMCTFLAQTMAILNSRPLCPLSEDPSDTAVLTPSHFLIGRPSVAVPEPSYTEEKVGRITRWQHVQQMTQHLWQRWSREYLHHLQTKQKWHDGVKEYNIGALVLLVEDNLPPQQWRRGRIIATHPGQDGVTRVVTVKTASSEFKRAVTKLAVLPSVEPEDSTGGV